MQLRDRNGVAEKAMSPKPKAYLLGGGVGSLAAAAFMIRDGGVSGENISILEALPLMGGSLDGAGDAASGYSLRGGRMLTTDNYECTWNLFKSIPSLKDAGKSVFDETVEFNELHKSHAQHVHESWRRRIAYKVQASHITSSQVAIGNSLNANKHRVAHKFRHVRSDHVE